MTPSSSSSADGHPHATAGAMLSSLDANRKMCHGPGTFSATATRGARNELGRWAPGDAGASGSSGEEAEGGVLEGDVVVGPGGKVWVGGRLRRAGGAAGGAMGMSDPWGSRELVSKAGYGARGPGGIRQGRELGFGGARRVSQGRNGAGRFGRAKMRGGRKGGGEAGCVRFAFRARRLAELRAGTSIRFENLAPSARRAGASAPVFAKPTRRAGAHSDHAAASPSPPSAANASPAIGRRCSPSSSGRGGRETSRTWNSCSQSRLPCLIHFKTPPIPSFPTCKFPQNITKNLHPRAAASFTRLRDPPVSSYFLSALAPSGPPGSQAAHSRCRRGPCAP